MQNSTINKGALPALLAALLAVGCGSDTTSADPYKGVVDPGGLDVKFQAITSSASTALKALCKVALPCYPAQSGFAHGKTIRFYNVLNAGTAVRTTASATSSLFPIAASIQPQVFNFPGNCAKGRSIDPRFDNYSFDAQFPIFRTLPLSTTAFGVNILPLVQLYGVSATGNTCNDLKSAASIDNGDFGATPTASRISMQLWPVVDQTANFMSITLATTPTPVPVPAQLHKMWANGLAGAYLDGGPVPVDSSGNIIAMDGVILNGASFANAYDNGAVILPAVPGDDGYSPVVRLRQYTLPSGKAIGDFTDICPTGASTCAANQVPIGATTASFNTIFIVSPL